MSIAGKPHLNYGGNITTRKQRDVLDQSHILAIEAKYPNPQAISLELPGRD